MSSSGWSTWAKGSGEEGFTNPDYPGWMIVDVYGVPDIGHEVRKDGEYVTRVKMFAEAVNIVEGAVASAASIPVGKPGQPYQPGQLWSMTWTHPGLRPDHEAGPDCPNSPHTCLICQPKEGEPDGAH
jgi:hypothetical protein